MTILEEYKLKVLDLKSRLDNVSSEDCIDEVLELITEASKKLDDMMDIIIDVGAANGCLADAFQIISDDLRK